MPNNNVTDVFNVGINGGNVTLDSTSSPTSITIDTLSLSAGAGLSLGGPASLTVNNNVTNSGAFATGVSGTGSTVTVDGTFTNNAGAQLNLDASGDTVNVGTLSNSGDVFINNGATLDLTSGQLITDIAAGSVINNQGFFNSGAGTNNALSNLTSVEGQMDLVNGATNATTPNGGTLTIANAGGIDVGGQPSTNTPTTWNITGNVANSGVFETGGNGSNTLTVTGAFTNEANGLLDLVGSGDTVNVASLTNNGSVSVSTGATLAVNTAYTGGGLTTVGGTLSAASLLLTNNGGSP